MVCQTLRPGLCNTEPVTTRSHYVPTTAPGDVRSRWILFMHDGMRDTGGVAKARYTAPEVLSMTLSTTLRSDCVQFAGISNEHVVHMVKGKPANSGCVLTPFAAVLTIMYLAKYISLFVTKRSVGVCANVSSCQHCSLQLVSQEPAQACTRSVSMLAGPAQQHRQCPQQAPLQHPLAWCAARHEPDIAPADDVLVPHSLEMVYTRAGCQRSLPVHAEPNFMPATLIVPLCQACTCHKGPFARLHCCACCRMR